MPAKRRKKAPLHFDFGPRNFSRQASICLRRTPGRKLVFTLTDLQGKVIFCSTSGAIGASRKFSRSAYVVEPMFKRILHYIHYFKIVALQVFLKMRITSQVFSFFHQCARHGIAIRSIVERYGLPHNGVRKPAAPRK